MTNGILHGLNDCRKCRYLTKDGMCIHPGHSDEFRPIIKYGCASGIRGSKVFITWIKDKFE